MKTGYDELVVLFQSVSNYAIKHPEATEIHAILAAYDQCWREKAEDLSGRLEVRESLERLCKDAVSVLSKATVGATYQIPYSTGTFLGVHKINSDRVVSSLRRELKPFNSTQGFGKNLIITLENDEENKCWTLCLLDAHQHKLENQPKIRHHKPSRNVKIEAKKRRSFTKT